MHDVLERIAPVLRLTRVTTAFAAVSNAWLVVLWTRGFAEEASHASMMSSTLTLQLAAAGANALGLFAFGACLNDIFDQHRDRWLRPDRPIPAGTIGLDTAVALTVISLMASVLGAIPFGTRAIVLTLVLAAGIVVFNGAARFVPAFGMVAYGFIAAGAMLVPNTDLVFLWPVWTVFVQTVVVSGLSHHLSGRSPVITRRAVIAAGTGAAIWSGVLGWFALDRAASGDGFWPGWVPAWSAVVPLSLALVFAAFCLRKIHGASSPGRAAEKVGRYSSLWLGLYACGWMIGAQKLSESLILGVVVLLGYLGMTTLREVYSLAEQPVGYRRA